MVPIQEINAGELLLQELCDYLNEHLGYTLINDKYNINSEVRKELVRFIKTKTNWKCDFGDHCLNRLIIDAKKKNIVGLIPSSKPTLCTICYVVLKRKNQNLIFQYDTKYGKRHGIDLYATKFNDEFIRRIECERRNPSFVSNFTNTCWYVYRNVVYNSNKRNTGRAILRILKQNDVVKAYYFTQNEEQPDWFGSAYINENLRLRLNLQTLVNKNRTMTIEFPLNGLSDQLIEGDIVFTSIKERDAEIMTKILLKKMDCSEVLSLREFENGADTSIVEIESKLRKVRCFKRLIYPECRDSEH